MHIRKLEEEQPALAKPISQTFEITPAQVIWAARHEMARTVEDVLARRTRVLFLDARAALQMAPSIAKLLAEELGRDADWCQSQVAAFERVARKFLTTQ